MKELKDRLKKLSPAERHALQKKIAAAQSERKSDKLTGDSDAKAIAIIGMAFRFPGEVNDNDSFWDLLSSGKNAVGEAPVERKDLNLAWPGGYLADIDKFDAAFFNISPYEAELMDPQQRLLLQTMWHTIEDAGYDAAQLAGTSTGLYVGLSTNDYRDLLLERHIKEAYFATGTSPAMVANRISYWFDFNGPSEVIDTACSSSLVALHQAVKAIHAGECEQALIGAANLLLAPSLFAAFENAGMLSATGGCKPFDKAADGHVRGEGVAALLLKPLIKAQQDNDRIYGVILGSAINHGGKANSLTAPSPKAQKNVLISAYKNARISPATITYIEAHSTGTQIGDPIEIEALQAAFHELQQPSNVYYCGIGSQKPQLGHLEATAGLAGIIKVLLAMRQQQLPGTLHFDALNPYITLKNSPFYIVEKNKNWECLLHEGQAIPRRAGVSSVGFGGTNAHIILQEYQQKNIPVQPLKPYYLITLSAKKPEVLKQRKIDLQNWLMQHADVSLPALAYTLNAGRSHFNYRSAFIVTSVEELRLKLDQDLAGQKPENYFQASGNKPKNQAIEQQALQDSIAALLVENADQHYLQVLQKIAIYYVEGCKLNWDLLHAGEARQRISLPNYPFLKKRYWVAPRALNTDSSVNNLHPLLGYNDATLSHFCYKTLLDPQAFYFTDHRVKGQKIFPGACYLEMARMAGKLAKPESAIVGMKNVIWAQPLAIHESTLSLTLQMSVKAESIVYEIISEQTDSGHKLHSQGELIYGSYAPSTNQINIAALEAQLTQTVLRQDIYHLLETKGLLYGPSFQALQWIKSDSEKILGYLSLAESLRTATDRSQYLLHPSLLDGALQTTVLLISLTQAVQKNITLVPFALDEITFSKPLTDNCYVLVEKEPTSASEHIQKFNIHIFNEAAENIANLRGLMARQLKLEPLNDEPFASQLGYYQAGWQKTHQENKSSSTQISSILTIGFNEKQANQLKEQFVCEVIGKEALTELNDVIKWVEHLPANLSHILYMAQAIDMDSLAPDLNALDFQKMFLLTKALFKSKRYKKITLLYVVAGRPTPFNLMLSGFVKTVNKENPKYCYQMIMIPEAVNSSAWLETLIKELAMPANGGEIIRYENQHRFIQLNQPITHQSKQANSELFKKRGIYLITGGLGGLGKVIAQYLAKNYAARLVLTGRSALTAKQQQEIQELIQLGSEVIYIIGDVGKITDVNDLIAQTKAHFASLNGIIHCAGILADAFIINKDITDAKNVLTPKVAGTLHLDKATQTDALDCFILFSSIASMLGNVGQVDYASANAFMDSFAIWRNTQVEQGQRSGLTISINWPLWQTGGMQLDKLNEEILFKNYGLQPLPEIEGIKALQAALAMGVSQLMVIYGNLDRFKQKVINTAFSLTDKVQQIQPVPLSLPTEDTAKSLNSVQQLIINSCAATLKTNPAELDIDVPLSEYGMDSILMMTLLNQIEENFGYGVEPNIFIDYPTISLVADYLIKQGMAKVVPCPRKDATTAPAKQNYSQVSAKIAVISMVGRFPQSPNLASFWENLAQAKSLITEVPPQRWLIEQYYSGNKQEVYKTYSKWGGFIAGIENFAADYFAIKAEDAIMMDPLQRLLLELSQELFDEAGYPKAELSGTRTGVFIGGAQSHYHNLYRENIADKWRKHIMVNQTQNMQAARIADFFDLKGPAYTIDTACSSSLVSIHQACQSMLNGECDLAIAGGAGLLIGPEMHINFSKAEVLSATGKSYVFDERANGFVLGEGAGLVLLKPYEQALADGDNIAGVILGSAVNNDGNTIGLTVPNLNGQQQVIQAALDKSAINPASISYYEAHGTGTLLGDPIEIKAMTEVYRRYTAEKNFCAVGSVKSNMGHALHAAGIAGFIKILLCLKNRTLVSTLNCEKPHPRFQFEKSAFYPITNTAAWELKEATRRAAISSFGFGGTNCHMIIEQAPPEHVVKRWSLPKTELVRKRYWLGDKPMDVLLDQNDEYYLALLKQFKLGEISESKLFEELNKQLA
jgi:acyl transferase domain-containing protein/acyl carrier protein